MIHDENRFPRRLVERSAKGSSVPAQHSPLSDESSSTYPNGGYLSPLVIPSVVRLAELSQLPRITPPTELDKFIIGHFTETTESLIELINGFFPDEISISEIHQSLNRLDEYISMPIRIHSALLIATLVGNIQPSYRDGYLQTQFGEITDHFQLKRVHLWNELCIEKLKLGDTSSCRLKSSLIFTMVDQYKLQFLQRLIE